MNWNETFSNLQSMLGLELRSISGKSDITLVDVNDRQITVSTVRGIRTRPTSQIQRLVKRLGLLSPIHVDSVLLGSGSSRNQPETILANMPDVEWLLLNGCKHIVWVGRRTHSIGTIKELDAFNTAELRTRYKGLGPLTGRRGIRLVVRAKNLRMASDFAEALLQSNESQALPDGKGYVVTGAQLDLLLLPAPDISDQTLEIIPVVEVDETHEMFERILRLFPDSTLQRLDSELNLAILCLPGGAKVAVEGQA